MWKIRNVCYSTNWTAVVSGPLGLGHCFLIEGPIFSVTDRIKPHRLNQTSRHKAALKSGGYFMGLIEKIWTKINVNFQTLVSNICLEPNLSQHLTH